MKKSVLAMALTLTLVCGSFLGFLPGAGAMRAEAAGTSTVSGGDAGETLVTPTNVRWLNDGTREMNPGEISGSFYVTAGFDGNNGTKNYEYEIYLDGELYKTVTGKTNQDVAIATWLFGKNGDGIEGVWQGGYGYRPAGKYKYRVRAMSADGKSYSEWSEFSWEYDNSKEAYMQAFGISDPSQDGGSTDSSTDSSSTDSSAAGSGEEDNDSDSGESTVTTVTTSSGGTVTSAASVNVTCAVPAVIRTPQSAVNAAAAAAVGGLKEGQYAAATVGNSSCGEQARQTVTNAASSVTGKVAEYLEITLDILNKEGETVQNVTQLSAPIEFTLGAPENIDGNQYDFAVVRLHGDGKVDILPDLDSDPATITFQTDRFSVYAVIYGPKGSFKTSGKDRVPKTGDSAIPVLPIAAAGASCAAAAYALKKKEQA